MTRLGGGIGPAATFARLATMRGLVDAVIVQAWDAGPVLAAARL